MRLSAAMYGSDLNNLIPGKVIENMPKPQFTVDTSVKLNYS
jgi:hypothetical protein